MLWLWIHLLVGPSCTIFWWMGVAVSTFCMLALWRRWAFRSLSSTSVTSPSMVWSQVLRPSLWARYLRRSFLAREPHLWGSWFWQCISHHLRATGLCQVHGEAVLCLPEVEDARTKVCHHHHQWSQTCWGVCQPKRRYCQVTSCSYRVGAVQVVGGYSRTFSR